MTPIRPGLTLALLEQAHHALKDGRGAQLLQAVHGTATPPDAGQTQLIALMAQLPLKDQRHLRNCRARDTVDEQLNELVKCLVNLALNAAAPHEIARADVLSMEALSYRAPDWHVVQGKRCVLSKRIERALERGDTGAALQADVEQWCLIERDAKHYGFGPHQVSSQQFLRLLEQHSKAMSKIAGLYRHNHNPIVAELFAAYASVVHNAGPTYDANEIESLAAALLETLFDRQDELMALQERSGRQAFDHAMSFPTTLCFVHINGTWRRFRGDPYKPTKVLEVVRKRNPDKCGGVKYRFRETMAYPKVAGRTDNTPLGNWSTRDWSVEPNASTHAMRAGLAAAAQSLFEAGYPAFCISEGGAFKGTAIQGSDIDSTMYVPQGCPDDVRAAANAAFAAAALAEGSRFSEGLRFSTYAQDTTRLELGDTPEMGRVINGTESGLMVTDRSNAHRVVSPRAVINLATLATSRTVDIC